MNWTRGFVVVLLFSIVVLAMLVLYELVTGHQLRVRTDRALFFLKTHKTGSTTVTSLILRKCIRDHKNCFIPNIQHPGKTFKVDDLKEIMFGRGLYGGKVPYDMWCHHAQYHPQLLSVVRSRALFVTIIRRPAFRFVSAWFWYHAGGAEKYRNADNESHLSSFSSMLNMTLKGFIGGGKKAKFKYRSGLDVTTEELVGKYSSRADYERKFKDLLHRIRNGEMLVLIADRMDESLVVFAKEMNWDMRDVAYISLKVRSTQVDAVMLTDQELLDLDRSQPFDSALFEVANTALDIRIKSYGEMFTTWLHELARYNEILRVRCTVNIKRDPLCEHYRLDNKDLVKFAWRYNLNPPSDIASIS